MFVWGAGICLPQHDRRVRYTRHRVVVVERGISGAKLSARALHCCLVCSRTCCRHLVNLLFLVYLLFLSSQNPKHMCSHNNNVHVHYTRYVMYSRLVLVFLGNPNVIARCTSRRRMRLRSRITHFGFALFGFALFVSQTKLCVCVCL